ncbi:MAG: dehydrogenase, partial [Planctomycetaceae bacterium]|nr:dehydrogenase [Planctomycetaceae bacterium]
MAKQYKMAVIGVGAIANLHAQAIADLDNAVVVGGSCRGEQKGRKFCEQWGGNYYADYVEMLDKEKPDVAAICTPSGLHLEPTRACAERGIHVICEKPLEITTARVDEMIAVADGSGITLGGIFPQRYLKVLRTVHEAASAGRFG